MITAQMKRHVSLGAALLIAGGALGGEPLSLRTTAEFEWGGDIRIRQVFFDDIPIIADPPGVTRGGQNHFFRFRSRLWGQLDFSEQISVYTRLVNEWRHYEKGTDRNWDWPDEAIVDALYLDVNGLLDGRLDARLGRQDLIYGTGKVILEGTPKDGSRTLYHDAVRLRVHAPAETTVDLLGIYNQPENQLAIGSENRDLTGIDPAFNDMTESGAGVYLMNNHLPSLPFEAYYLYKRESSWTDRNGDGQLGRNVHTVGSRWMPATEFGLSANVEVARQFGETGEGFGLDGWMADAVVRQKAAQWPGTPLFGVGVYHISGNKADTGRDEGWNPLWARWPQYSELYVYAFDAEAAGRWSNVTMPYLSLRLHPCSATRLQLLVGQMLAPETTGPGGGRERGWLGTARYDFTIGNRWLTDKDRLFGHLLLEVLKPGDYYIVDNTAYFARWEISYAF